MPDPTASPVRFLLGWTAAGGLPGLLDPAVVVAATAIVSAAVAVLAWSWWQQRRDARRQRAEIAERRQLEHERDRFFEMSIDMICVAGMDGYFKLLNPAFETTLGYSREELLGQPFIELVHPDDRAATLAEVEKLATGAQTLHFENRYRCKDGSYKWLSWSSAPDPERGLLYALARDTTQPRAAAEAAAEAREMAEAANLAKSRFLANMSHELRTPLNSVIGFTNLLLRNKAGNLRGQDLGYLERVLANGKHLLDLITDVLDLSKIEAGKVELDWRSVSLSELVLEVCRQMEAPAREREVRLLAEVSEGLRDVRSDPGRLKQVLINVVGNALKFTRQGEVKVTVVADPDRRPQRIEVADTGIGIPAEQLESIFQPFQQADSSTTRQFGGTGLGLSISRSFCELLGYRLSVESEVDVGSTFRIHLATAETTAQAREPTPEAPSRSVAEGPAPAVAGAGRRLVLVIDDEADSRILLSSMIEDLGYRAVTADSGAQGLWMATQLRPALVILDLMMPGKSGWEVLREMKSDPDLCDIPVIVVSLLAGEERGGILGALDVLEKPLARDELHRVLLRNLGRRPSKVLVVEDDSDTLALLTSYLAEMALETRHARNGRAALEILESYTPDVVIADLLMPVMDGMTLIGNLRKDPRFAGLPIVVVTAKELGEREAALLSRDVAAILKKGGDLEQTLIDALRRLPEVPRDPAASEATHPVTPDIP